MLVSGLRKNDVIFFTDLTLQFEINLERICQHIFVLYMIYFSFANITGWLKPFSLNFNKGLLTYALLNNAPCKLWIKLSTLVRRNWKVKESCLNTGVLNQSLWREITPLHESLWRQHMIQHGLQISMISRNKIQYSFGKQYSKRVLSSFQKEIK